MSNPVILGVTVTYPAGGVSLAPGETATIDVEAVDADNYVVSGTIVVTDKAGNWASSPFSVVVADSITFAASADQGAVVADPTTPGRFFFTAPA